MVSFNRTVESVDAREPGRNPVERNIGWQARLPWSPFPNQIQVHIQF
jgi:hypothetical protein